MDAATKPRTLSQQIEHHSAKEAAHSNFKAAKAKSNDSLNIYRNARALEDAAQLAYDEILANPAKYPYAGIQAQKAERLASEASEAADEALRELRRTSEVAFAADGVLAGLNG